MKNVEDIEKIIEREKEKLLRGYKIKNIGIFGSYAKNSAKEKSDIDLIVEFEEPVSLLGVIKAENYLTELLGIRVDLVPKEDIRKELKETILKEVIYI
ncbi:MAG TPA: nucleotidyltransferase family protein [Methanofastidiosum sp.]|jgi:predicted nucleotidyltransferase|nr:nucleotidyltransferase family protein [Methanofastidiosum sp.]NMA31808.1 nucleotidyltransferase family protein [Candidatus Methanofastidiosa archaeon]HOE92424.1 nucleotidyltransferase family protein [Methanofastidiosum sp.]HOM95648.1 nucleotidyltransferase family protein [Methanofastidiosum sp.]HOR88492.1 nucleotidyltransferase family protein [Methanofastidiosum sp.]